MKRQRNAQSGGNRTHNSHRWLIGLIFLGLLVFPAGVLLSATTWTGLGGADDAWSLGVNWTGLLAPLPTDGVTFNAADSGNANVVDTDFTIAGLQYLGNGVHTTDFSGASNLQINGPVYVGYGSSGNDAAVTWTNGGSVTIGDPAHLQWFYIATNPANSGSGSNTASLFLEDTELHAYVSSLIVGAKIYGGSNGQADGRLILGDNSHLHVGTTATPATMGIGYVAAGGATGLLDATRGEADLHLTDLNVGQAVGYGGRPRGLSAGIRRIRSMRRTCISAGVQAPGFWRFRQAGSFSWVRQRTRFHFWASPITI